MGEVSVSKTKDMEKKRKDGSSFTGSILKAIHALLLQAPGGKEREKGKERAGCLPPYHSDSTEAGEATLSENNSIWH